MSKIAWTQKTWNPIIGCSKISEGCKNCYAEKMARRLSCIPRTKYYKHTICGGKWSGQTMLVYDQMNKPSETEKPTTFFVCSMGDIFHETVYRNWLALVWLEMVQNPQHIFQVLTKRPARMLDWFSSPEYKAVAAAHYTGHIWIGVTAENQACADKRIPLLLQAKAQIRFVSIEPMLEPVDIGKALSGKLKKKLDWVIAGCESGHNRRPCKVEWIADVVGQCKRYDTPVFVKQIDINGKVNHTPKEWPEPLQVRQWPIPQGESK